MSFSRADYIKILLIILLWAGNVIAIKLAVGQLEPLTAATLRFLTAGLLFLPFTKLPDRRALGIIFQISMLMNVLHIGLLFVALGMLDAASTSILLQTQVVFATILGMVFFKEKIRWRTWTGIGLAVLGLIVMLGEPDLARHPSAVVIMLVSTLTLSFAYIRMKHLQSVHPATYVCLISLFAAPFSFAASLFFEPGSWSALPQADWLVLGAVLAYQCVLVSLSHIVWQRLLHKGDVGRLTAFTLLIPLFAVALSVIFLGEHIAWPMIAGGGVTMIGVGIITARRIQKGIA